MYKDVTIFFSQDNVATIAHVIPTMDRIDAMLSSSAAEPLSPSVKKALSFAWKIMDKYYLKTDLSSVYWIAMGTPSDGACPFFANHWSVSPSSSTETQVFSATQMAQDMGQHCRRHG